MLPTTLVWLVGAPVISTGSLITKLATFVTGLPHSPLTTTRYIPALVVFTSFRVSVLLVCPPSAFTPKYH